MAYTALLPDFNGDGVLVGRPTQDIHEESAVQNYPVGTIHERHGRRFRYCKAYEAITVTNRGCPNMVQYPWIATSVRSAKFVSCNSFLAGDKRIVLTVDDVVEDSPYAALTKNFFAGGYINAFFDSNAIQTLRVSGNEVGTVNADSAANTDIILYLDEPFAKDYAAGCTVDLYASPYIAIGASGSATAYSSFVVVPHLAVTSGYWFWGQTRGPCWVTPNAGITTANVRDVYFHSNGTVKVNSGDGLQRAGYILYKGDGSQDDSTIMLQLE